MDLGGLSGGELLDHVDRLARVQRKTEVQILVAAGQHAVVNDARVDPGLAAAGQGRGAGTPLVAEFSPATLVPGWVSPPTRRGS